MKEAWSFVPWTINVTRLHLSKSSKRISSNLLVSAPCFDITTLVCHDVVFTA